MRPVNLVLALRDPQSTDQLLASLRPEFRDVVAVRAAHELRYAVARLRAPLALIDLELFAYGEVQELCREFPGTAFVCMHRLADDRMWSESVAHGAADCCQSNDVQSILFAADRYVSAEAARAASAA